MNLQKSAMIRQIESIPELLENNYEAAVRQVSGLFSREEAAAVKRLILTGCGDSLCVARAAGHIFQALTGLDVQVMETMELSRYYPTSRLKDSREDTVVVAISVSGRVARVVEAIQRVNRAGGMTLALCGNPSSPVYQNAQRVLSLTIPPFDYAPGVRSYSVCLQSLALWAIWLGEAQGQLSPDAAGELRSRLAALPGMLAPALAGMDAAARDLANRFLHSTSIELVAAGCDRATAEFGSAKVLETSGIQALWVDTEDWLHTHYFVKDVGGTCTVVFANQDDPGLSRAEELLEVAAQMGRPCIVVTDRGDFYPHCALRTPKLRSCWLNPLVQYLPLCYLATYLGEGRGEEYFRGGKANWTACTDCATLISSDIKLVP